MIFVSVKQTIMLLIGVLCQVGCVCGRVCVRVCVAAGRVQFQWNPRPLRAAGSRPQCLRDACGLSVWHFSFAPGFIKTALFRTYLANITRTKRVCLHSVRSKYLGPFSRCQTTKQIVTRRALFKNKNYCHCAWS